MVAMAAALGRAMVAVAVVVTAVAGQDGMDDLQDMESMLAPPGQEGDGAQAARPRGTELTIIQQTTLALQQLGIVIGKSSLCGAFFKNKMFLPFYNFYSFLRLWKLILCHLFLLPPSSVLPYER